MTNTRAHKATGGALSGDERRRYTRALLTDLRALEKMLAEGMFERGQLNIGAEQEMFLVDSSFAPAKAALDMMDRLKPSPHFTTELGMFQLEANADPQTLAGKGLAALEAQFVELYAKVQEAGAPIGISPVMTGILPTITKTDLGLDSMVPNPRYMTLNRVLNELRGEPYDVNVRGLDELTVKHETIMTEACNSSFQVHVQVPEPERFAHWYNVAQIIAAPLLSVATNAPILFGKRLWQETRIALFPQSCDIRVAGKHPRERKSRVSFGSRWVENGVMDIFKENVARFRALVGTEGEENALAMLARGRIPELKALRLHNGTIYPWNRPCYGISPNGKPHLRIEQRALPAGPTIPDEIANAAFWLGMLVALVHDIDNVSERMEFERCAANFDAAAREGLGASLTWLDGEEVFAQPFVLDKLLPLAESGLARAKVDDADAKRYLGIIEARVRSTRTGSRWMLHSLAGMKEKGSHGERLNALVAAMIARQKSGRVVSEWERARLDEAHTKKNAYAKVSQYMTTDLFTVEPDDPIELVADVMNWERVRYIPVEDGTGKLIGLVTTRAVLRHFADLVKQTGPRAPGSVPIIPGSVPSMPALPGSTPSLPNLASSPSLPGSSPPPPLPASSPSLPRGRGSSPPPALHGSTPVSEIMRTDLVTVTPDTPTLQAIARMREHRIGCLPVVHEGNIVGIVTEEDFMGIAAELLEDAIGEVPAPVPPRKR